MSRHLVVTLAAGVLVLGGAGLGAWKLARRPSQAHILFSELIPKWSAERHNGLAAAEARTAMMKAAHRWPAVEAALRDVDAVFPDGAATGAALARLNAAARDVGLRFHVDPQTLKGRPILLTYTVEGGTRWWLGERSVEVMRVRRLDHLNIELGLSGHAGNDRPVVMLDRLEPEVVDLVLGASDAQLPGRPAPNRTDKTVSGHWRRVMEGAADAGGLRAASELLQARASLFEKMQRRMLRPSAGRLLLPGRFVLGDAYFEELYDLADVGRPGGAMLFSGDVLDLERADGKLQGGEVRRALDAMLALETSMVEAHEARHALDPVQRPAPALLAEVMSGLTPDFVKSAELELRAFVAQIADAPVPPCLGTARIARDVRGSRARPTPHFYAGWVLLREMSGEDPGHENTPALLDALCALPDAELRGTAAAAYARLYGEAWTAAVVRPGGAYASRQPSSSR